MGKLIVGQDPLPYSKIMQQLKANTRHIVGGIAAQVIYVLYLCSMIESETTTLTNNTSLIQAVAAIENAVLDVVGKAYGVPVCALFGGPFRTELPVRSNI